MNPFHISLLSNSIERGLTIPQLRIEGGVDSVISGFLFFNAYETVKFPEVVCDKKYFFLYSTDHDSSGGILAWGKGDKLDLRDFKEVGVIANQYQSETPRLLRIPSEDGEVLHLYFHTNATDLINGGSQQTRLWTSSGSAELHEMNWTDRGNPLGILTDENHTGYLYPYKIAEDSYLGIHLITANVPQHYRFSTSTDGRTWVRGSDYDIDSFIDAENTYIKPSYGLFFNYYGRQWWLGTLVNGSGTQNLSGINKDLVLAKSTNFQVTEICAKLNDDHNRNYSIYKDGDIAQVYVEYPAPSDIYHATYDLNNLKNYL